MLFAGLQGQAEGRVAVAVLRDPHQAARQLAGKGLPGGKEGGVGATKAEGDTKALGVAHHNIGPKLAGGPQ